MHEVQEKAKDPAAIQAIGDILTAFQAKLATDTSQWPWQTIESALISLVTGLEGHFKENEVSLPITPKDYEHYVEAAISENGSSFTPPAYSSRWQAPFSQELFHEYLCYMSSGCANREDHDEEVTKELSSKTMTEAERERLLKEANSVWNRRHCSETPDHTAPRPIRQTKKKRLVVFRSLSQGST